MATSGRLGDHYLQMEQHMALIKAADGHLKRTDLCGWYSPRSNSIKSAVSIVLVHVASQVLSPLVCEHSNCRGVSGRGRGGEGYMSGSPLHLCKGVNCLFEDVVCDLHTMNEP